MAQLIAPFNALQFDPTQGSGSLPAGKHKVIAESSEVKPTQNNDGGYLQFNLKIIEGPNAGMSGAFRLNLYNSSQKAVEIANKQMSALCHVTGVFQVSDSSQLHNIPFMVEVQPQKDNPQYTEVKKIFDANGNEPKGNSQAPAHSNPPQQPQQPAMQGQSNPVGGFGSQAPQQPQGGQASWGQPAPQQQPQQQWQAPQQQQQPAAAGWQQQQPQGGQAGGSAPWGR